MPNRRLTIPEDIIAKHLLDKDKKPTRCSFVDWSMDVVLQDPAWKEGGEKQSAALMELCIAIQDKLDGRKAGEHVDLSEEEQETFLRIARKTERGYAGDHVVFNRKTIRFLYAIASATEVKKERATTNGTNGKSAARAS